MDTKALYEATLKNIETILAIECAYQNDVAEAARLRDGLIQLAMDRYKLEIENYKNENTN